MDEAKLNSPNAGPPPDLRRAARYIRSLLVVVAMLTSAATASAECAWVMWSDRPDRITGGAFNEIYSAHATRKECDGELPGLATLLKQKGYEVAGGFPGGREVLGKKGNDYWRFYCLPDTVDPRGPKGK